MNTLENLKEFGLGDKESVIYLYLIEHTNSPVYQIAKETKIPRTTVYSALENLKHQGLASIFKKNNVAYWVIENPKRLVKSAEERVSKIKEILPELESLFGKNEFHPNVKFYTGKESMRKAILSMFDYMDYKNIRTLHTISHPELLENFPKLLPEFIRYREKLNIHTKLISHPIAQIDTPETYKTNSYRETRFLPEGYPFNCTMMLGGDMATFLSFKDNVPYTVTIESPTIVNMFQQIFRFMWSMCEK